MDNVAIAKLLRDVAELADLVPDDKQDQAAVMMWQAIRELEGEASD